VTNATLLKIQDPLIPLDFIDFEPKTGDFLQEVLNGLGQDPKGLAPKFFYDERGLELFHQICDLDEYYITRTEMKILNQYAHKMAQFIGENTCLIELGSANSQKVRVLLEHIKPKVYVPIDISKEHLLASSDQLIEDYPELEVIAICADYTEDFRLPELSAGIKKIGFFPGSTIGNLNDQEASKFLSKTAKLLGKGGGLLIGVDLKKDPEILEAAYNDASGVTEEFNKNILRRINRELGGNFDLENFNHLAHYNAAKGRVEMHLISLQDQNVVIDNQDFFFSMGESIHTENSYKYSTKEFHKMVEGYGFEPQKVWTDSDHLFSVHYLTVR